MLDTVLNDVLPYLYVGVPIVLTGMGLPVPEELFVIGAGVASHNRALEPWAALITCITAAIIGDCFMYAIGYRGHAWLRNHPRFARLFKPRAEKKMERKIRQHGLKALFIARFLVGVRSPVYVAAGILRVPFRDFIVCDLISASVVVSFFFGLSYLFAEHITNLWSRIRKAEIALTVSIVAGVIGVIIYFYVRHRRRIERIRLRRLRRPRKPRDQQPPADGEPARAEGTNNRPSNESAEPSSASETARMVSDAAQAGATKSVA
jgi:membrane protein DedA with SNARE-associated domain